MLTFNFVCDYFNRWSASSTVVRTNGAQARLRPSVPVVRWRLPV